MSDLFGDYYRRVEPLESRQLARGQFCWAPTLYLPPMAQSVAVRSYNPADERGDRYAIVSSQADDPARFDHAPIHEIRLEYNEALYAVKGKVRPVIIMSQRNEEWQPGGGARWLNRARTIFRRSRRSGEHVDASPFGAESGEG